jgi:3-dehydroquinate dehydratase-1
MSASLPNSSSVVGTVHSHAALRAALRLKDGAVDFLELRVDHFAGDLDPLRRAVPKLRAPLIVTVRHPREGGAGGLTRRERELLYAEFLRCAVFIDVEVRSLRELGTTIAAARAGQVGLIVSDHYFKTTPSLARLRARRATALTVRPDIFKIATLTRTPAHFAALLEFLTTAKPSPAISVMGMGAFGKISRLALALAGSVLNYGYLGEAQVPGQWPAVELKRRLAELGEG